MNLSVIINGVLSLFLIMLIGVYGSKRKIITPEINKGLTNILLEITLPCLIVSSFVFDFNNELRNNIIKSFVYSPLVLIITILVSYIVLLPIKSDKKVIMQFANVFSNCGFIGFPIIHSIFGSEGVIYASIFNMFFTMALWTYGVVLFNGNIDGNNRSFYTIKDKDNKQVSIKDVTGSGREYKIILFQPLPVGTNTLTIQGVYDTTSLKNIIHPYTKTIDMKDLTQPKVISHSGKDRQITLQ